jgi:hypothetical protein
MFVNPQGKHRVNPIARQAEFYGNPKSPSKNSQVNRYPCSSVSLVIGIPLMDTIPNTVVGR